MEVLLLKDHEGLGARGTVAKVAKGYARNYLIPRGIAVPATERNRTAFARQDDVRRKKLARVVSEASAVAEKIASAAYTFEKSVSERNELYGSVTQTEIAERLQTDGFDVDRKQIIIEEPINRLGLFYVKVALAEGVMPELKIWVVRKKTEEAGREKTRGPGSAEPADEGKPTVNE